MHYFLLNLLFCICSYVNFYKISLNISKKLNFFFFFYHHCVLHHLNNLLTVESDAYSTLLLVSKPVFYLWQVNHLQVYSYYKFFCIFKYKNIYSMHLKSLKRLYSLFFSLFMNIYSANYVNRWVRHNFLI